MNKAACFVLLALIGGFFPLLGQGGKSPLIEVNAFENVEAKRVEIRLRLSEPVTINKVEATAGGRVMPVEFVPFGAEGAADSCALLFLIDKSDPKRAKTIEAAKALTLQLIERSAPHTDAAVYTFDANLDLVADFGTPWEEITTNLKKVKAVGKATELYRNTIEAIAILEKRPVERRGLVLFSDGKAEDTTYPLEQVVAAAKKASVVIFTVGYAETPQAVVHLQSLRRLAAETGGPFGQVDMRTRQAPPEFVEAVHPLLRSGGFARVDLAENQTGKDVQLTIHIEGREPFQQSFPLVKLAPPPLAPMPPPPDPKVAEVASKVAEMTQKVDEVSKQMAAVPIKVEEVSKKVEADRKADELKKEEAAKKAAEAKEAEELAKTVRAAELASELEAQAAQAAAQKQFRVMLGTAVGLALIAAAILFLIGQRRKAAEHAEAALAALPIFARLQVLDGDGTEHLMRTTALRVGRGKDNDLTLGNDSVSRHHAEISRTREGVFTITELNAGNGVLVNGEPVEKAALRNEDIIELGEVRIRFLVG